MAHSAHALKQQIEAQLARRIPAALSPAPRVQVRRQPLADVQLNQLLGGGVPEGGITEVYGAAGSGRTSLALSLAAAVTSAGNAVSWIDVGDELDPETAALCGVGLQKFLWVRCSAPPCKSRRVTATQPSGPPEDPAICSGAVPSLVALTHKPRPVGNGGCGSPHPRGEYKGMAEAINSLLQAQPRSAAMQQRRERKTIGTPGAPNRDVKPLVDAMRKGASPSCNITQPNEIVPTRGALFGRQVERKVSCGSNRKPLVTMPRPAMPFPQASPYREEQVPTDRQPSRRAAHYAVSTEPQNIQPAALPKQPAVMQPPAASQYKPVDKAKHDTGEHDVWAPLDQALRSIDLLLQGGGFCLIVLDLGSLPANMVWRIPMATWFRFRAGCERSRASLLVLSQHPCARASADMTVAMHAQQVRVAGHAVMTGRSFHLQVEQQRRNAEPAARPEQTLVPFRKPPRADCCPVSGNTWTADSPWSIRA